MQAGTKTNVICINIVQRQTDTKTATGEYGNGKGPPSPLQPSGRHLHGNRGDLNLKLETLETTKFWNP